MQAQNMIYCEKQRRRFSFWEESTFPIIKAASVFGKLSFYSRFVICVFVWISNDNTLFCRHRIMNMVKWLFWTHFNQNIGLFGQNYEWQQPVRLTIWYNQSCLIGFKLKNRFFIYVRRESAAWEFGRINVDCPKATSVYKLLNYQMKSFDFIKNESERKKRLIKFKSILLA
jgi:hypothetical protein